MAVEDSNEKRRRELEEILELRRSFGTLGRRLVNRQAPMQTGLGPTLVPLSPQPDEENPDADERQHDDPELELDHDQEPDQEAELRQEPVPDEGPDQDHQERPPAPEPEPELAREPHDQEPPDQEPEQGQEEEGKRPEAPRDRKPAPVSTTVRRMTPIVDESYRGQATAAQAASQPFQIPDPPAARRRPWLLIAGLVAVIAVVFALGMAVGHAVVQPSPQPAPPASSQAAPLASTPLSSTAPAPQVSVPPSCLVTAERADVLIDLLVRKARGIEVTRALHDYTLASQTCRKEASSR